MIRSAVYLLKSAFFSFSSSELLFASAINDALNITSATSLDLTTREISVAWGSSVSRACFLPSVQRLEAVAPAAAILHVMLPSGGQGRSFVGAHPHALLQRDCGRGCRQVLLGSAEAVAGRRAIR